MDVIISGCFIVYDIYPTAPKEEGNHFIKYEINAC